MARSSRG